MQCSVASSVDERVELRAVASRGYKRYAPVIFRYWTPCARRAVADRGGRRAQMNEWANRIGESVNQKKEQRASR